jgi:hypothetical protein
MMIKTLVFVLFVGFIIKTKAQSQIVNSVHQRLESSDYMPEYFGHEENEFCDSLIAMRSMGIQEIGNAKDESWHVYPFLRTNICKKGNFEIFKMSDCLNFCNDSSKILVTKKMNCVAQCDFVNLQIQKFLDLTKILRMQRDSLLKAEDGCREKKPVNKSPPSAPSGTAASF